MRTSLNNTKLKRRRGNNLDYNKIKDALNKATTTKKNNSIKHRSIRKSPVNKKSSFNWNKPLRK